MLKDRAIIAHALLADHAFQRQQELLIGFVADGMGCDLPSGFPVLV